MNKILNYKIILNKSQKIFKDKNQESNHLKVSLKYKRWKRILKKNRNQYLKTIDSVHKVTAPLKKEAQ